jgi:hypothetical protein
MGRGREKEEESRQKTNEEEFTPGIPSREKDMYKWRYYDNERSYSQGYGTNKKRSRKQTTKPSASFDLEKVYTAWKCFPFFEKLNGKDEPFEFQFL